MSATPVSSSSDAVQPFLPRATAAAKVDTNPPTELWSSAPDGNRWHDTNAAPRPEGECSYENLRRFRRERGSCKGLAGVSRPRVDSGGVTAAVRDELAEPGATQAQGLAVF